MRGRPQHCNETRGTFVMLVSFSLYLKSLYIEFAVGREILYEILW